MEEKYIFSEIQNIVEQIIHKYTPSKIILFGSAARREYDKVNDLDFLIIKQAEEDFEFQKQQDIKGD